MNNGITNIVINDIFYISMKHISIIINNKVIESSLFVLAEVLTRQSPIILYDILNKN